jgi:BMFP domain-containing protein YqiC
MLRLHWFIVNLRSRPSVAEEARSASAPYNCSPWRRKVAQQRRLHLRRAAAQAKSSLRRFVHSPARTGSRTMPQTQSRFFDDLSRLMTDAAGLADGARREAQTFARTQMERMMAGMDIVTREEFEAVKEMAARARDENEKLQARIAALEAKLAEPKP